MVSTILALALASDKHVIIFSGKSLATTGKGSCMHVCIYGHSSHEN